MHIYISLHILRDLLQVVDKLLLVLVDLVSFLGDDTRVDVEGLSRATATRFSSGSTAWRARKVEQMPRSTRFLMVCRYGEKWMTHGLQLCAA